MADLWVAASTVCRVASTVYGPSAPASELTFGAVTVPLPGPDDLARLLAAPPPRWWQPTLFNLPAVAHG